MANGGIYQGREEVTKEDDGKNKEGKEDDGKKTGRKDGRTKRRKQGRKVEEGTSKKRRDIKKGS